MTVSTYTEKDLNSILANKIQSITSEGWLIDSSVNRKCSPDCTFQILFTNPDCETKVLFVEKTDTTHTIIEEELSKNKSTRKAVSYTKASDGGYIETSTSKSSSSVGSVAFKSFIDDTPHAHHRLLNNTDTKNPTPGTCPLSDAGNLNSQPKKDTECSDSIPSIRDMIHNRAHRSNWLWRRKHNKPAQENKKEICTQQTDLQEAEERTLSDYINTDNIKKPETSETDSSHLNLRRKTDDLYNDLLDFSLRDMVNMHRSLENLFRHVFWL